MFGRQVCLESGWCRQMERNGRVEGKKGGSGGKWLYRALILVSGCVDAALELWLADFRQGGPPSRPLPPPPDGPRNVACCPESILFIY